MKKRKYSHTQWNLQLVWVQRLAQTLMDEHCMRRDAALQCAHLTRRLLELMGEGAAEFAYLKSDNTVRVARGTLAAGTDPLLDAYEYRGASLKFRRTPADNTGVYTYWDLDRHEWRTFRSNRLIRIYSNPRDHEQQR